MSGAGERGWRRQAITAAATTSTGNATMAKVTSGRRCRADACFCLLRLPVQLRPFVVISFLLGQKSK